MERYQQAGGGIVAIHNATDMRGNYAWWDDLVGSLMPGHAATGTSPGLPGTVRVEDRAHPSTEHLDAALGPRRRVVQLLRPTSAATRTSSPRWTSRRTTPGGNAMGYDHPISWCKPYDGGRAWVTGMGHFGAHFTGARPRAAHRRRRQVGRGPGRAGDCGGTDWDQFEKVALDENTSAPFAIDVAPDGRVFFTELVRGQIRVYDPTTQTIRPRSPCRLLRRRGRPARHRPRPGLRRQRLAVRLPLARRARTTATRRTSSAALVALHRRRERRRSTPRPRRSCSSQVPARRLPDEPGHTGGGLDFDRAGQPVPRRRRRREPALRALRRLRAAVRAPGRHVARRPRDRRPTPTTCAASCCASTRGRRHLLRSPRATCSPPGTEKTRPEIYAMGFRNPFRFSVDPETGWHRPRRLLARQRRRTTPPPAARPASSSGTIINEPGNYGWPLCMGDNEPFRDVDYTTNPVTVGDFFDCDTRSTTRSRNTGLTELPPVKPRGHVLRLPAVLGARRDQPGRRARADGRPGLPVRRRAGVRHQVPRRPTTARPSSTSGRATGCTRSTCPRPASAARRGRGEGQPVPAADDGRSSRRSTRRSVRTARCTCSTGAAASAVTTRTRACYRIDYISGSRSPSRRRDRDARLGQAPLEVTFDGSAQHRPRGRARSRTRGTSTATARPTPTGVDGDLHLHDADGVYDARLTVTDPAGKTGTTTVPVTVGNTRPDGVVRRPADRRLLRLRRPAHLGRRRSPTPRTRDRRRRASIIQPALGHDDHAHPSEPLHGRTGTVQTSLGGGHSEDMNVFYVLDARYTDNGGDGRHRRRSPARTPRCCSRCSARRSSSRRARRASRRCRAATWRATAPWSAVPTAGRRTTR